MSDTLARLFHELANRATYDPRDGLVRLAVRLRARDACEYCLLSTGGQFQIDHIIPPGRWADYIAGRVRSHPPVAGRGGPHHLDNFAWACPFCNDWKHDRLEQRLGRHHVPLFDPRLDHWRDHFFLAHQDLFIVGLTPIGRATTLALGVNDARLDGPLGARHRAILAHQYPPSWTHAWNISLDP